MQITCVLLVVLTVRTIAPSYVNRVNHPNYRLPRSLWPTQYDLEILPFIGYPDSNFTYQGQVYIEIECVERTNVITLHAKDLHILVDYTYVEEKDNGENINIVQQKTYPEVDFYTTTLQSPLYENHTYLMYVKFTGYLTEGLAGFYRSSYEDKVTKETRWLAVTQFEATDARRAFPCFDEPEYKARFKISIGRLKTYRSISNMPLLTTEPMKGRPDWTLDHFQTSERMSTYLVAFIVSDMEYHISDNSDSRVMFRIWARRDAINQTNYASQVGPMVLDYFENYFRVHYPLPKQDMVAIPDFNAGAMENWGLITYREAMLLYDPEMSSVSNKHSVVSVISHELAHQWFGNLVTMKWWSDLWLNEGFATYVAILGVHQVYPQWNCLQSEAVENLLNVFTFDSLVSSHSVSAKIGHPNEIGQIFDTISYKKGALLLRMMNFFLSEEVFRNGLTNYLGEHRYQNAEQDDLWYQLSSEAHKAGVLADDMSVKKIMDTWTLQTGYPLVTVFRDYQSGAVMVTQKRYLSYQTDDVQHYSTVEDGPCWLIPITYTVDSEANFENTRPRDWLSCSQRTLEIPSAANSSEWVIFNINVAGLYRVNYDEENWQLIRETLDSDRLTRICVMNRVQLINDVMDLAWTGYLDYETALQVMDYLPRETEYLPWRAAISNLSILYRVLGRTSGYGLFRQYVRKLLSNLYGRMGNILRENKPDDLEDAKYHSLVVAWACRLDMGNCLSQARELYTKWMQSENPDVYNPIPRDMRSVVYCMAIKHGGEQEWNFAWQRYLKSNLGAEKLSLLSNLGCTREVWLLQRFLEWSLDEETGIRRQDSFSVFGAVVRNEVGYTVAKDFLYKHISDVFNFYGPRSDKLSRYLSFLGEQIYSLQDLDEFQQFNKANQQFLGNVQLSVKQALEKARINIQWHSRNYKRFISLLKSYI